MDDNAAFIQAILEDPTSDTKRLVYADWLEEHDKLPMANYLRTELSLAKIPANAAEAGGLRTQLWQAWATVDPGWLMIFTQPRMLRANPTEFPSSWRNFGLPQRPAKGTYGTWPYESIPALPLAELRGDFRYLIESKTTFRIETEEYVAQYREDFQRLLRTVAELRLQLPESFIRFMNDLTLHTSFRSVTDCYFTLPGEEAPIRPGIHGEGVHVLFYCDSQYCVLWDLFLHSSGAHCVIARKAEYFTAFSPVPDEDQSSHSQSQAWFVAPSFEAFLYRVWMENQVWYVEHADFPRRSWRSPPKVTPQIQQYIDYYRK